MTEALSPRHIVLLQHNGRWSWGNGMMCRCSSLTLNSWHIVFLFFNNANFAGRIHSRTTTSGVFLYVPLIGCFTVMFTNLYLTIYDNRLPNALICLDQSVCWLSQPWPRLGPIQRLSLIPVVHDTLIVSAGDGPKLAILLQHYHLPRPNHGLIKVVSHGTRVQRGQVN